MKVAGLGEVKNDFSGYVKESQKSPVLVTRHGKPAAILVGVDGQEFEALMAWAKRLREKR